MEPNSQLRNPTQADPMERRAKQGSLRGGLFPYNQPDKNIYAGLGKPASAPENQPAPGGMLAPQQLRGAQNGQTQTAVAGAGPSGEGGATGSWGGGGGAPGVPGSQGRVLRLEVPEAVKNYRSPLPGMFPATAAKLRQGGAERSEALDQGKYIKAGFSAVGDAVSVVPKIADDILGGFARGSFNLLRNPVEDAGRAALGMEDRKEPTPTLRTPAPTAPNQTAAPTGPNSQAYQLRQGTLGENDNAHQGDISGRINAAMKSSQTDLASTGMRANDIYKTKSANGTTSYSGYGDGSGKLGNLVSGDGTELRGRGSVSSVPAGSMSQSATAQTMRNPNGSTWSAQDNAIMAANLRDGVNPTQGTSGGQMGGATIIGDGGGYGLLSKEYQAKRNAPQIDMRGLSQRQKAQYMIAAEETAIKRQANEYGNEDSLRRDGTSRRGQDMTASTAKMGNDITLAKERMANAGASAAAQRAQANDDRKYQLDVVKLGVETANKNRDDKRAGEESFVKRIAGMVGDDKDGSKAARVVNGANMFLGDAVRAAETELRNNPGNAKAARDLKRLQEGGVGSLDDKMISQLVLGQQAAGAAQDYDGAMPWNGTAKASAAPIKSLTLRKGMVFDDYVSDSESGNQVIPARALKNNPDLNRLVVQ